jgi:hypothetical protein
MLQAAIAAVLLLGIYKLVAKKPTNDDEFYIKVDWWLAFAFVLVPAMLIFFIGMGLAALELPTELVLVAYVLYFVVPLVVMKMMLDFKTGEAIKLACFVPVVAIIAEIPFVFLANA